MIVGGVNQLCWRKGLGRFELRAERIELSADCVIPGGVQRP